MSHTEFARLWRKLILLNHFVPAVIFNGGLVGAPPCLLPACSELAAPAPPCAC